MDKSIKVLITGDNGESLPTPFGGIIKRCLLHSRVWKDDHDAKVYMHIHHKHADENDLGAGATYFYDFLRPPTVADKAWFLIKNFCLNPWLFLKFFYLEISLVGELNFLAFIYHAARVVFLNRQVKAIKPDIIVTVTGGLKSLVSLEVAKKYKIPIILENYAEIQYRVKEDGVNVAEKYRHLWKYLLNGMDLISSASQHCSEGPLKYVADSKKVTIIYNGIDFNIFNYSAGKDKNALRQIFNLPQDKFLVMAVGALKMRKGHDQLFEAMLKMPESEFQKINVVLCGSGSMEEIKEKAAQSGFPKDSLKIFQGLTEENLAALYASVDCFCFPSVTPRECMGMAMKEAMAAGLPVVAYDMGGIKEAVQNNVNGFLVGVGERETLAKRIIQIMRMDINQRELIKQNNIAKCQKMFDVNITANQFYREMLKLIK